MGCVSEVWLQCSAEGYVLSTAEAFVLNQRLYARCCTTLEEIAVKADKLLLLSDHQANVMRCAAASAITIPSGELSQCVLFVKTRIC
jgi:hypothetical protein